MILHNTRDYLRAWIACNKTGIIIDKMKANKENFNYETSWVSQILDPHNIKNT